jgi:hypothetical protein
MVIIDKLSKKASADLASSMYEASTVPGQLSGIVLGMGKSWCKAIRQETEERC